MLNFVFIKCFFFFLNRKLLHCCIAPTCLFSSILICSASVATAGLSPNFLCRVPICSNAGQVHPLCCPLTYLPLVVVHQMKGKGPMLSLNALFLNEMPPASSMHLCERGPLSFPTVCVCV